MCHFATRTTRRKRNAINILVACWSEEQMAAGASPMGDNLAVWFRAMVRQLAMAKGIVIVVPDSPELSAPAKAPGTQKGGSQAR
jgi:hypothetical protein